VSYYTDGPYYDDFDDDEREEEEPAPMFGCACQNALVADEVCPACVGIMERMEREARARPSPRSERVKKK
jgi:hypothetical protein